MTTSLDAGIDTSRLREPEFAIDGVAYRVNKMPVTKAFSFLNMVRGELGRDNRPANAMSVALTTVDLTQRASVDEVDPQTAAAMLQGFLELLFGLSEEFVEHRVRLTLFRYIQYRSELLTAGQWAPLYDGALDNSDEVTEDWAVLIELMVRAIAVNFTGTSRLSGWFRKAGIWGSSQFPQSE